MIRRAVRNEEKLDITYQDEAGSLTERRIRPIAVIYYSETANIVAWCDLRQAIRNFRADRVKSCVETQDFFKQQGEALRQLWMANWQYRNAEG
jgi:predicted DNA-binding transcriptional regulator YafY